MQSPARAWREYPHRYRLEAATCDGCGAAAYPPRPVCPSCHGRSFSKTVLPRTGKVVTFTIVRVPPAGFTDQSPLVIALVEIEGGVRTMVQLADVADLESVTVGMPVRLEFRRIQSDGEAGVLFYGHKAVPA